MAFQLPANFLQFGDYKAMLVVKTGIEVKWSNVIGPFSNFGGVGCGSVPSGWVCKPAINIPSLPACDWARIYIFNVVGGASQYIDATVRAHGGGGKQDLEADLLIAGALVPPSPLTIFDDTTPIYAIAGASVEIYGPNTSPNSGDAPVLSVGTPINRKVPNIKKFTNVNGQTLIAPNAASLVGNNDIRFEYPDIIRTNNTQTDMTKRFAAGDILTVSGSSAVDPGGAHGPVSLDAVYQVLVVAPDHLVLANPVAVNGNWATVNTYTGSVSTYKSPFLFTAGPRWVGPFIMNVNDMTEVWSNFVAANGLYKDDGTNSYPVSVDVLLGVTACDGNGTSIGNEIYFRATINGSSTNKTQRAITLEAILPLSGPCSVRAQRLTATDLAFKGTVVDEIKWRDLYSVSPVIPLHFGDVTTIHTQTYATEGALTVKDRKLNLLITRNVRILNNLGVLDLTFTPSKRADNIICAILIDPLLGNRSLLELNTLALYNTIQDVIAYFGTLEAADFCYTFDDSKVSFEEMLADIATAVFSVAYRRGSIINLSFEKKTVNSTLLFNHRNKIPNSETRTVTFGMTSEFDGIEYDYIDPISPTYQHIDTKTTLYFPTDKSAKNAKKVTSVGVRNKVQATFQGWRLFQKLKYQNTAVQFDATQEAAISVINDRILVADNTRSDSQDGEVTAVNGLLLTLSQPVKFDGVHAYNIFLQHNDASVESIGIVAGPQPNQVVLAGAPALPLITDPTMFARTTYMIVNNAVHQASAFLLAEKTPKDGLTYEVKATNYDDRYYDHDQDFALGTLVDPSFPPANGAGFAAGPGYPGDAPTGNPPIDPINPPDDGLGAGGVGGHGRFLVG